MSPGARGCDTLLFQTKKPDSVTMPGKAMSGAGQGESAMAGSAEDGSTGGPEVSLAAIALWGHRAAYVGWEHCTALQRSLV